MASNKIWNYAVTAQKPTVVTHSLVGNFTSPKDLNLIISKSTRIEIHLLTPEGLQPLLDVGLYGRIATMELFRPPGEPQDLLFISTERYKFCVLAYDTRSGEIVTRANGDISDKTGRVADVGHIGIIDPENRMIGLHMYDGQFKVIPIDAKGLLKEAFNIRIEELQVVDIQFLHGTSKPTICMLYQDQQDQRHVRTYEVLLREKELGEGPFQMPNVEGGASMLIPVPAPLGGVLVIGEHTITHLNAKNGFKSIAMKSTVVKAYGRVDPDGTRYLLGDFTGQLMMLILERDSRNESNSLLSMRLEYLGETSIPSTLSYLDNGVVYIGSTYGDAQLVKMTTERDETTSSYLTEVERYTNLGSIVDFAVVDLERQGQGQVVTCSGAFKDGSLRIVRNGVGINEQATIELPGIKGLWSLKPTPVAANHGGETSYDKYIILSFVGETRVLAMTGEELEETEIPGFQSDEQTIYSGNIGSNQFIQITGKAIHLVDGNSLQVISKWSPESQRINVASCYGNQIVLGIGGGTLVYLEVQGNDIKEIKRVTLEHEISCVNIHSLKEDNLQSHPASLAAVGMWTDISVRLFTLPGLTQVTKELLGGEIIPRSVLLASFEGIAYLLCALGDGHLFTFTLHPDTPTVGQFELRERKKVSLGTQPILLNTFRSNNHTHIFAASDRPTVIYSSNKKLLYSNVNLREVNTMCSFHSESFPDSLALAAEESLTIGTIDDIQKLHIRTVPLGEMPRRIAHQASSNSFGLLTLKIVNNNDSKNENNNNNAADMNIDETESCFVKLVDDQTFEIVHSFPLNPYENGCSILSCNFNEDSSNNSSSSNSNSNAMSISENSSEYYVVGTAYAKPEEPEPKRGRILVFSVVDAKLKLVAETEVKGAVYSMTSFNGKLLVGVNSKVQLFKWSETQQESSNKQLVFECDHSSHILVLHLVSRGDFIVVGDLMKSVSLLLYKPIENTIEEIARDYNPNWLTAIEALDDDTYLAAENSFNLFTVRRNSEAATDEERARLEVCGQYHLGEFVNRFRHGSLVMKMNESTSNDDSTNNANHIPTLIYGTVNGSIGVLASLPQPLFALLQKVQQNLNKVIKGVGGFKHEEWRAFSNDRKTVEAKNFVDGDLIEAFLDLKADKMQEVVKGLDISVEDLTKEIENLQRALH